MQFCKSKGEGETKDIRKVDCKAKLWVKYHFEFWILTMATIQGQVCIQIVYYTSNFGRAKEREITKVGFKAKLWVDTEVERAIFSQLKFKHWKEKDKRKKQRKRKRTKKKKKEERKNDEAIKDVAKILFSLSSG